MIFKTIEDETAISGQRIVGTLQARKIAQQQATAQLEVDIACLKKYEIACQGGSISTGQFDSIMKKASVTAKEYTVNIQKGTGSAQAYAQSQKANNAALQSVGIGAGIASKAVKLLSATMNTIAFTTIFSLISKGISWVTGQINNYIHRNEIAIEKAEELLNTFKSEIDEITSKQDKINGYADEFKELSEGVDDLGRNVSLTADEYSRYQNIVKEIVGINPSLISGYDEENNILADKNGLLETSIQLLKDEYNQKLKNIALPDNIDTAIEGAIVRYNSSKEDFLEVEIPTTLAFSGVKIDENGNRETGYVNQISKYIEDVIGVEFTGWEGGINQYILDNAEAVFDNLDKIKERASQTKDGWEGLNDSQLIDLMDYFRELRIAYNDMNNATTSANPTLQYVAMAEDSYSQLTDIQKKFIADYVNGIQVTSETTEQEKDNIRKSIISLTQELSNLDDINVNNALADLYAIPTDKQSIGEFIEQFRNALEIIKAYCKENGIEIPIAISDSEQSINDLEAQYQRAVDFAKDKFDGYDPTDFFKEHSINTQEEIDAWQKIAQGARDATEAEKKYVQDSTLNYKHPTSTFEESWADSFTSENESTKELGNNLIALAEQGRLTVKTFNEADSIGYFKNLDVSADEAVSKINKLVNESTQLSSMSSQISAIAGALGTKQTDGFVNADTLSGFDAEVRGLKSWDQFQAVLGSTASSYEECQKAANALASEWIRSNNFLAQLTESNKDYYETQLMAMGVENASEVIYNALSAKEALVLQEQILAAETEATANNTNFSIAAFLNEAGATEIARACLFQLVTAEQIFNNTDLSTIEKVEKLKELANAYGQTAIAARIANMEKASQDGHIPINYEKELASLQNDINSAVGNVQINPNGLGGAASHTAGAGKSAAEAYIDAFEEELSDLGELRDNGVITEKEYLDQLRALYEKHFQNKLGYEKEYAKYQRQYLEGYKSLYESALSGISKLLGNQIDGYNDAKDAAVATLTDEKEARLAVIDAQKDLIDEQIDAKQKLIDDIQDEIDAMKEANDQRQRQLDLQKAQYELERMQHQRTILQYSEEGGMQYVQDDDGLRAAKENVDNARFEIEISNKEKNIALLEDEISLLEEQKDAIQDQMDILDKQAEQIENYYSKMITETESYYDTLISNMEKQKSKWEEIAEIESVAKAYSDLEQVAGGMGYTVQDLLSGNEQAFEDFKSRYISLLSDLNNNSSFSEGLSYATSGISESINNLEASAATVSESTGSIAANIEDVNTSAEALSGSLSNINHALSGFSETDNITAAADAFSRLGQAIQSVANALNISEDGTIGNLADALQSLCEMPLCETESNGKAGGFLSKFQALKNAVSDVTNAISGGGSSTSSGTDASSSSSPSMSSGANAGSSGSLTGAIESLKSAANEALGSGNSSESDDQTGGSGIISQFGQLKKAVTDTTAAVGNGDSAQGEQTDDTAGGGNLISSISDLGTATTEILTGGGDNDDKAGGVIGRFEQFKDVIGKANDHVTGIKDGLTDIDGETVECTIKVNIEQNGELPSYAQSALGHMKLESAEYHAKHGSALAKGTGNNRGLSHAEKNALRSEYGQPELTVYPNGTTELTTQPTISDLPKGTVVFNEAQTKKIFQNKPDSMGKTYTDGSIGQNADGNLTLPPAQRPSFLVQQELQEECFSKTGGIVDKIVSPVNMISHHMKEMTGLLRNMNQINHNGQNQSVNIGDVNINCPGITSQEVARQVGNELNHIFSGFHNYADQQSRIR